MLDKDNCIEYIGHFEYIWLVSALSQCSRARLRHCNYKTHHKRARYLATLPETNSRYSFRPCRAVSSMTVAGLSSSASKDT